MLKGLISAVIGTRHDRERRKIQPIVDEINEEYARLQNVSDEELRGQTEKLRGIIRERTGELEARVAALREAKRAADDAAEREKIDQELSGSDGRGGAEGELRREIAEVLDELLPEAFATVREACRRLLGTQVMVTGRELSWDMVPYDVQLMGGIELHLGKIAEMATGEGKTLVATLPLYLNALPGKGSHLVTVNSYLARRDSQWMGHVYTYLGLTVACIDDTEPGTEERRNAYLSDITYGTNNEFGFDYLRDNMVQSPSQRVQRSHTFAIVDEVDSVLIDEARTPLIISGPVGNDNDPMYFQYNSGVERLVRRQTELVNSLVGEAERDFEKGDSASGSLKLYKAQLGSPKNRRLFKLLQETGNKTLVQKMELDHIADRRLPANKQQFRDIEDDLLFVLDEKGHQVHLTDRGVDFMSPGDHEAFVLPDISLEVHQVDHDTSLSPEERLELRRKIELEYAQKSERLHIVHQLLRAHALYERDVNYVVQEGEVLIVDEFTGRTMPGRRWSEGLHQAVEAKEGVHVKGETQTMATITIQNYFRMYDKLAGMTGTAETEETEFFQIYGLEVAVIPTNKPVVRDDRHDWVYKTRREKYNAILEETRRLHGLSYPVLIGTTSVDASETLARMFQRAGIKHNVLNAKYHQREAEIVAGAGQPGAVTIATNMAGRGTDIVLGGNPDPEIQAMRADEALSETEKDLRAAKIKEDWQKLHDAVVAAGGLHIIGSERHESRRIDNQLRGRSGRQGDPGSSRFFLAFEDPLLKIFAGERLQSIMRSLKIPEGEAIEARMVTRSIENAQRKVEARNFDIRKNLLEFDDVANDQRKVIYAQRNELLEAKEISETIESIRRDVIAATVQEFVPLESVEEQWDLPGLEKKLEGDYFLKAPIGEWSRQDAELDSQTIAERLVEQAKREYDAKFAPIEDPNVVRNYERAVMLQSIDVHWREHLASLDYLRQGIHLRGYAQKQPKQEYKREAFELFGMMLDSIKREVTRHLMAVQVRSEEQVKEAERQAEEAARALKNVQYQHADFAQSMGQEEAAAEGQPAAMAGGAAATAVDVGMGNMAEVQPFVRSTQKVGRNDPCPCGSGKKFKQCHGKLA